MPSQKRCEGRFLAAGVESFEQLSIGRFRQRVQFADAAQVAQEAIQWRVDHA